MLIVSKILVNPFHNKNKTVTPQKTLQVTMNRFIKVLDQKSQMVTKILLNPNLTCVHFATGPCITLLNVASRIRLMQRVLITIQVGQITIIQIIRIGAKISTQILGQLVEFE